MQDHTWLAVWVAGIQIQVLMLVYSCYLSHLTSPLLVLTDIAKMTEEFKQEAWAACKDPSRLSLLFSLCV